MIGVLHRTGTEPNGGGATQSLAPLMSMTRPSNADLAKQIPLVMGYADSLRRIDCSAEILVQLDDHTLVLRHGGRIAAARMRWTLELLAAALRFCAGVEHRIKHALAVPRPHLFADEIQPMIATPSHRPFSRAATRPRPIRSRRC